MLGHVHSQKCPLGCGPSRHQSVQPLLIQLGFKQALQHQPSTYMPTWRRPRRQHSLPG